MDIEQSDYLIFLQELEEEFEKFLAESAKKHDCERDAVFEAVWEKIMPELNEQRRFKLLSILKQERSTSYGDTARNVTHTGVISTLKSDSSLYNLQKVKNFFC
ncbi:MAG: hypothetical protein V1837_06890 [Candidatus Woesearchaeota archaeon]